MLLTEQEIKDLLIPLFIRQDQASIHWPDIFEEAKRNLFSRDHNNGLQHAIDIIRELKERK